MGEPPHVHATGKGGAAKVWLETLEFADHQGFKASDLKRIVDAVSEHRTEILEAWNEFFQNLH